MSGINNFVIKFATVNGLDSSAEPNPVAAREIDP